MPIHGCKDIYYRYIYKADSLKYSIFKATKCKFSVFGNFACDGGDVSCLLFRTS